MVQYNIHRLQQQSMWAQVSAKHSTSEHITAATKHVVDMVLDVVIHMKSSLYSLIRAVCNNINNQTQEAFVRNIFDHCEG